VGTRAQLWGVLAPYTTVAATGDAAGTKMSKVFGDQVPRCRRAACTDLDNSQGIYHETQPPFTQPPSMGFGGGDKDKHDSYFGSCLMGVHGLEDGNEVRDG
jgi:hypothetical protein